MLDSGAALDADIVVTATGLVVKLLGGIALRVDGAAVNPAERFSYKGMMLSDVPNLALSFGYTNASWTLKCDLTSRYVCRMLNHMDRGGYAICVPRLGDAAPERMPMLDFSSGYVQRAAGMPAEPRAASAVAASTRIISRISPRCVSAGSTDGVMDFRKAGAD